MNKIMNKLLIKQLETIRKIIKKLPKEENTEVTKELLNISGFESAFERANQQVMEGKVRDWREIRDDV